MKKGDFIKIEYTAKIKDSGKVFDTTDKKVAEKEGIFNPKVNYGSVLVIVGEGKTVKGLDKEIMEMKVGENKKVEILPKEGFGERKPELFKLMALSEFKKQNIEPYPGMILNMENNLSCRILSVNSGRVRVDFNHPLAGKTLVYDLEIKEKLEKREEKIKAVCEYYNCGYKKVEFKNEEIEILIKNEIGDVIKEKITDDIFDHMDFNKIRFSQTFERKN